MKKLCYSAFIAFCASIATLAALYVVAGDDDSNDSADGADATNTYTLAEVAAHNTREDCWLAIEGKVYDVTAYIEQHPTPPSVLVPWCGTEATDGMRTKGYGRDHSPAAWQHLEELQVGVLAEAE